MEKKTLVELIETVEKFNEALDSFHNVGIDIYDSHLVESFNKLEDMFMKANFTEEGVDWIYWYLYERISLVTGEVLACYDENGKEFFVENPEDLWELVKEYTFNKE